MSVQYRPSQLSFTVMRQARERMDPVFLRCLYYHGPLIMHGCNCAKSLLRNYNCSVSSFHCYHPLASYVRLQLSEDRINDEMVC